MRVRPSHVLITVAALCSMSGVAMGTGSVGSGAQGSGAQAGGPARATPVDWRDQWRAARNAIVDANPDLAFDPTSILVKFRQDAVGPQAQAVLSAANLQVIETWALVPGLMHVRVNEPVEAALARVAALGGAFVEYAEPDLLYRLNATPNDSFYSLLWGMNNTGQNVGGDVGTAGFDIDANLAWDVITNASSVVVGVADSGILRTHEDLGANIWTNPGEIAGNRVDDDRNGFVDDTWGWDFWNNDNNPTDDNGHGTHVAGTIGGVGNNGRGVVGVAWNARLAGLKIGSRQGSISTTAAISALNYCVGKGIRLSNHSWGGGGFSSSLSSAITNARNAGHMIVAAAGNGGSDGRGDNNDTLPQYPASYSQDNIISVAAIDNDGRLAVFSNFGATSVDLGAPGVRIASSYNSSTTSYVYLDGTSMATPHVTGVAALVWAQNPTWTYSQVRSKILSTVNPLSSLSGRCTTGGLLNANNAVR